MTKEEKALKIEDLKRQIAETKREVDYQNALQLALKLILNGSYGSFSNQYFPAYSGAVAASITAHGRDIVQFMEKCAMHYFYKMWHLDTELHNKLGLVNVRQIPENQSVVVYADTDSNYISFKPAMESCNWLQDGKGTGVEFIHKVNDNRIAEYFNKCLNKYAKQYGVENIQDFELEKISESIINIAKKKYIQHVVWAEGVDFERLTYIVNTGVELVRSSTPLFARSKIPQIIKYLFANPETFNIKELLSIVKGIRKEFELTDVDDISMQSSCSNYETKVLEDKENMQFVSGAHFAVKCSAFYNHLLHKNQDQQSKYDFIKSGTKIKYYYCLDDRNPIFAFIRGAHPIEFAPAVDYDTTFEKAILSPINSIIKPLKMPEITKRLSVVMGLFSNIKKA
jgi:DNA polymerase elongation subunit (family B)